MDIIHYRGGLKRTLQAIQDGRITLGFIGGSITDARPDWLARVGVRLVQAMERDSALIRRIWDVLNRIDPDQLFGEGRVYGGRTSQACKRFVRSCS